MICAATTLDIRTAHNKTPSLSSIISLRKILLFSYALEKLITGYLHFPDKRSLNLY